MEQQHLTSVMIIMIALTAPAHAADPYRMDPIPGSGAPSVSADSGLQTNLDIQASGPADCCAADIASDTDRLWLISTRHLSADTCSLNLRRPNLYVARLDRRGSGQPNSLDAFFSQLVPGRPLVIHIHGNRMSQREAHARGRFVHHNVKANLVGQPIDFVVFSWPSERTGLLIRDGRIKAQRTDADGLYLAWLLRELVIRDVPVTVIGYSFGGRVATGGLHALGGGRLGGRQLPGETIAGANIGVGLIAPAIEENWLERGQYHGLASQNIREMALFYNPRDAILRRYWLIDLATRGRALGFAGPQRLATGFAGSPVPLVSRNCSLFLGVRHSEVQYYTKGCRAGRTMAALVRRSVR